MMKHEIRILIKEKKILVTKDTILLDKIINLAKAVFDSLDGVTIDFIDEEKLEPKPFQPFDDWGDLPAIPIQPVEPLPWIDPATPNNPVNPFEITCNNRVCFCTGNCGRRKTSGFTYFTGSK